MFFTIIRNLPNFPQTPKKLNGGKKKLQHTAIS